MAFDPQILVKRLSEKKTLMILAVITLAVFALMMYIKGSLQIFDQKLFYSKDQIRPMLDLMGADGRATYRYVNALDFIFFAATHFCLRVLTQHFLKQVRLR